MLPVKILVIVLHLCSVNRAQEPRAERVCVWWWYGWVWGALTSVFQHRIKVFYTLKKKPNKSH
jgi:hypothetical protein